MLKAYLKIIAVILVTLISCTAILLPLFEKNDTEITGCGHVDSYNSQYDNITQNTPDAKQEETTDNPLLRELMRVQEYSEGCYI